jgi:murein DD-endopeptidase MepM/ murein hydrolase activator NlpD
MLLANGAAAQALPRAEPVPGGVAELRLSGNERPRASYDGHRVMVVGRPGEWTAVVGIPLDAKPGPQKLTLGSGTTVLFHVAAKHYAEQRITLKNKQLVNPTHLDMKRIEREEHVIKAAKTEWTPRDHPPLTLEQPVHGPYSSPFGLRRFFNNQPRQPHSGIDIAVPKGTPVRASASGRVSLTGDFFFDGKTVFIDHGQGLETVYCHMEKIIVNKGQEVARGQVLGLSGMTGRATGPHVHWSVFLNDTAVDPELFLGAPIRE